MPKCILSFFIIATVMDIAGCANSNNSKYKSQGSLVLSETDYSKKANWVCFGGNNNKSVDLFVVYPTLPVGNDKLDMPFVRIDNPVMKAAAELWLTNDAGCIFEAEVNVFAPLYRQINIAYVAGINSENITVKDLFKSTPREDVFAAFDYFLKNINKGERPFILFGFSQGGCMIKEVATTLLGHEDYQKYNAKHIITYAIGESVSASDVSLNKDLKFSESRYDTGAIVSWNSTTPREAAEGTYENFTTYEPNALVTNPVIWTLFGTAPKEQNGVSRVTLKNDTMGVITWTEHDKVEFIPAFADADADPRGILIISSVDTESWVAASFPTLGQFHGGDVNFFYESIRNNINDRIRAFSE